MIMAMSVMVPGWSRFGGAYVATCPVCGLVCAYWDESDLNDNGDLECERCNEEGQDDE